MELFRVSIESHCRASTLYIAGFLAPGVAERATELLSALPTTMRLVRVDLRAVVLIDPSAFVQLARALTRWRDACRGQVLIEFPERSHRARSARPPQLYPRSTIGTAVSTAIN